MEEQDRSCILIENYKLSDTITNEGIIDYEFPINDFLNKGLDNGILSLDNTCRYSEYFPAIVKTVFGEDPLCGTLNVFNCVQLLMDLLITGSFMLKIKVLQMVSIQIGPAGGGKTRYLTMKQSIFADLSKTMNMYQHHLLYL